jgi:hypothetical protein
MPDRSSSCIVLIPIGPLLNPEFLGDTLRSVRIFLPHAAILAVDNTTNGIPSEMAESFGLDIIRCPSDGKRSIHGRLYFNCSNALRYIITTYDFETVLRLDDDALVIGSEAAEEAIQYFKSHPDVGCLGSYRVTCTGSLRDFSPPRGIIRRESGVMGAIRHPRLWKLLRGLLNLAHQNGYEDGEHALAAAMFLSRSCVVKMSELGFLGRRELINSKLGDDQIFGLLIAAAGFRTADFATEGRPLGLAMRGLPASPGELVAMRKKIVHSVKYYRELNQHEVRSEFKRYVPALAVKHG